jgi:hypothetical protein
MVLKQYADDTEVTEVWFEYCERFLFEFLFKKLCEILSRTVTTLRESSSPILNTLLELLQNIGPNILHSQFLNFVRNVCQIFAEN